MADLVVDYNLLSQTESSLNGLMNEFSNIKAQEHAYFGDWGSGDIAGAMDDFAANWDYHRKKLLDSMHSLAGMVKQCQDGFCKTDTTLASDITGNK